MESITASWPIAYTLVGDPPTKDASVMFFNGAGSSCHYLTKIVRSEIFIRGEVMNGGWIFRLNLETGKTWCDDGPADLVVTSIIEVPVPDNIRRLDYREVIFLSWEKARAAGQL